MDGDRFEELPYGEPKTVERLRAMVQNLDPETRACSTTLWAADEIDRLREHIKTLHRLNGYSKQKGWWCSCGEIIQPSWVRYRPDENSPAPHPWSDHGRQIARSLHEKHVGIVTLGGEP